MKVYFRDSQHNKRFLGETETKENAWKIMRKFMDDHNFTCYYTRIWFADGYTWFDVGSHTEYFLVDENLMEEYENEQEEEKEVTRYHSYQRNKDVYYRPK